MKLIRKMYDWVLSWAQTKYGLSALVVLSFMESSFFPIPPDPLLIALILGLREKAFKFALYCTIASVTGALFGYSIGHFLWWTPTGEFSPIANFFFYNIPGFTIPLFKEVQTMYETYDFWIVFTAAFTPIPYKVITISSGAFNINLIMFLIASLVGRGARFFLVTLLLWKFGESIKLFIDKYFNLLSIVFTVLLIGGFLIIKLII